MVEEHEHAEAHHHHLAREHGEFNIPPVRSSRGVAMSVVFGAIIIAGSILYSANLVSQTLNNQTELLAAVKPVSTNTGQTQQQAATGQQAAASDINVTGRGDAPVLGNSNAKVTIVEFGDFQCPYCQQFFQNTLPEIKKQYIDTGKVKIVFRHFPLTQIHVNAQISAVAAECANQQGKFWEYHDLLYTNGMADGTGLDKASLEKYADQLGLNKGNLLGLGKNKFNQCLETNATLKIVQADQAEGAKDGVTGTPTFYINGKQIVGAQPFESTDPRTNPFKPIIEAALK